MNTVDLIVRFVSILILALWAAPTLVLVRAKASVAIDSYVFQKGG